MNIRTFEIKPPNKAEDLQMLTPKMFIVWGHFMLFATTHQLPIKVTNIKHKFKVSRSNTHPEGRAIDISIKGWSPEDINKCVKYMEREVSHHGALSSTTWKSRVIVYHDAGLGPHFHLQVRP